MSTIKIKADMYAKVIDRGLEELLEAVTNIDRCNRRICNIDGTLELRIKLNNLEASIMNCRDELRDKLLY